MPAGLLAAGLLALGLAGCGASESNQVRAKVEQFVVAVHDHDYATICHQVLAPELLFDIASGDITCEHALRLGYAKVRGATLVVGRITVSGNQASVLTLSQAKGQDTAVATLELVRTGAGWRVESLGNAA